MKNYYIQPNNFTTDELVNLLVSIPCDEEEKNIEFEKGEYHIDAEKLLQQKFYITNTVGDNEFSKTETPHLNRAPIYLNNLKNLTINGNGARLVLQGKSSNMIIVGCEDITLKNFEITTKNPEIQELELVKKGAFFVDYNCKGDPIKVNERNAWWTIHFPKSHPDFCQRIRHPLHSAIHIKKIGENKIRAYTLKPQKFNIGDKFYVYDVRRDYVGIFVENSKNITLENISQRFNHSLAFVAQNTENITIDNVNFTPEKDRKICSLADFLQICMCRGKVTIKNSFFNGAGDDCMNVHGFHFKIVDKNESEITVRFMHPQSHGYNPFNADDEIEFINPKTLLSKGSAKVISAKLLDEYNIRLTLDNTDKAILGEFVENADACPHIDFINNHIENIVTRGLLITTRGRVNIENNRFGKMGMSGILLSNDTNNWFESGACYDVTIKNNTFDYCGENGILIKPENIKYEGAVHKNIKILGNTFKKCEKAVFSIKDTDNVKIKNNKLFDFPKILETQNATNIEKDF